MSPPRSVTRLRLSTPITVASVYALVGLLWIVFSDVLVARLGPAGQSLQTVKGALFIGVTALTIYLLLARRRIIPASDLDALARDAAQSEHLSRSLAEVRAAQTALAQSEARLRRLIEVSLDAIVTISTDGLILDWNDEAERMFGWSRKDAIGENFESLIVPAGRRDSYRQTLKQIEDSGAQAVGRRRFETSAMDRLDREFPVELTVAPVEMGDRIVVTLFMRDISDRARAEREARLIQAIVNAAPFAIISVDGDSRILSWNPAAEKMYGWRASDLRGLSIEILFPPDSPELLPLIERVRLGVAVEAEQGTQVRRDGRVINVVRTLVPLEAPANGPRQAALLCADLSDQQHLERRLSDAEYLASLGRLAGTVAHEFNNVLMGIQSFSEVIARSASDDPKTGSAVNQIRVSVQRGRRITEDILRFTRAAAAPALHAIPLDEWIGGAAVELQQLVGSDVRVHIETGARNVVVVGDQSQLFQVITNLAINAKDAMPEGGAIYLSTRAVSPSGTASDVMAEICLRDTGAGMDEETAAHAFEPLFTTKKRGGTGLGLSVVQKIVHAHSGQVSFESTPGEGTTFRILLPARVDVSHRESAAAAPRSWDSRRILLVEDDVAIAAGLGEVLRSHGMALQILNDGSRVLEEIARFRPDIVVLDVGLPDRSGVEVYHEIAASYPKLAVLFSTGHADEARLEGPLARPHVGFLRKPYPVEALLDQIEQLAPAV